MFVYRNIWPLSLLLLLSLFLAWSFAAWALSSLVRRKTCRGLRITFYLSFPFLLIITGINLWQLGELVQVTFTNPRMLPSNFLLSFVFLLVPLALIAAWTFPRLWKLVRSVPQGVIANDSQMSAEFVAPQVSIPSQIGLAGSFVAWLIVLMAPSFTLEFLCLVVWLAYAGWRWSRQSKLHQDVIENGLAAIPGFWSRSARRFGIVLSYAAGVVVLFVIAQSASRLPSSYSMNMDMNMSAGTSMLDITQLSGPRDVVPDRRFTLTAQKTEVKFDSGQTIEAWTYDGQVPGPEIRVRQGELIEVTLRNKDIENGVTIHWHGVNVPNAEDGVAGVTQDAVMPGESFVYRFRAVDAGSYWYHSHQSSFTQVGKGLFGPFIVEPQGSISEKSIDMPLLVHAWDLQSATVGFSTFGTENRPRKTVMPGSDVRLRVVNTDPILRDLSVTGTRFKVAAIDGVEINEPGDLDHAHLSLSAGGRYDLRFTMPDRPVLLSAHNEGAPSLEASVLLSADGTGEVQPEKTTNDFNPIDYGKSLPDSPPLPTHFDQNHVFEIDAGGGFVNGQFGLRWLVNGRMFPNMPSIAVHEGELIKITFINRTFDDHPMHPHGHRMRVLSRNGKLSSGSPWWSDTLNVAPGETVEVALKADNPGVWMNHCHNLFHAVDGFVMHLMYENVMTPFKLGSASRNTPE